MYLVANYFPKITFDGINGKCCQKKRNLPDLDVMGEVRIWTWKADTEFSISTKKKEDGKQFQPQLTKKIVIEDGSLKYSNFTCHKWKSRSFFLTDSK
jgi:hypothetical protein